MDHPAARRRLTEASATLARWLGDLCERLPPGGTRRLPDPAEPTAPPPNPAPEVAVPGEAVLGGPIARAGAGIPFGGPADYAAMLQEAHQRNRHQQAAEMRAYNALVERERQMAPR